MQAREFSIKKDYGDLCSWFRARDMRPPLRKLLPLTGYIVEDVACGFLYGTDSGVSFLDVFVTNPEASIKARARALDLVMKSLIARAVEMKYSVVKGESDIRSILKLCTKNGFKILNPSWGVWMEL